MKQLANHYGLVISSGITKSGKIPFFILNKLDHAYCMYKSSEIKKIIVSGGLSSHNNLKVKKSDAHYLSAYLQKLGIPKKDIIEENKSIDLLSSAYYCKKLLLKNKLSDKVIAIISEFEEEGVNYIFRKVFGHDISFTATISNSQIKSEILWHLFNYQRQSLSDIKSVTHKMLNGDHSFLDGMFFSSDFYKKNEVGYIRKMVANGQIGKRRRHKTHYSMLKILKKRDEVYAKYNIENYQNRIMMADYWSGRYINFFGKTPDNTLLCLKFLLYLKDKKVFKNEAVITRHLYKNGAHFVPEIIDVSDGPGASWYLYKVIKGNNSGNFSYDFSFSENFFKKNLEKKLANNLFLIKKIQNLPVDTSKIQEKNIKKMAETFYKKLKKQNELKNEELIDKAFHTLIKLLKNLKNEKNYINHSDIHPGNVIISGKKPYIIDFEKICYSLSSLDYSFIKIFSLKNPLFISKFTKEYLKKLSTSEKKDFYKSLPATDLFMGIFLLRFTYSWEHKSEKNIVHRVRDLIYEHFENVLKSL